MSITRPIIGITADNKDNTAASGVYQCAADYPRAVARAGGTPVVLPQEVEHVEDYLALCDALLLTGGVDPDPRAFPTPAARTATLHPKARPMAPRRQAFETALLAALDRTAPRTPVLGVCLGMQMMALHAGGRLNQHLPDTLPERVARAHQDNHRHPLIFEVDDGVLPRVRGAVVSSHRQAVEQVRAMRVVARAPDGVIEAIDRPERPFYLGVQWHPERADADVDADVSDGRASGVDVIGALVDAVRAAR